MRTNNNFNPHIALTSGFEYHICGRRVFSPLGHPCYPVYPFGLPCGFVFLHSLSVPDPYLEICWVGGPSSRPLNRGGGPVSKKLFFGPSGFSLPRSRFLDVTQRSPKRAAKETIRASVWSKNNGAGGGGGGEGKGTWKQEIKQLQLRLFHLSFQLIFFAKLSNKIKCEGFFFSSFRFPFLSHTLTLINAQHYTPSSI